VQQAYSSLFDTFALKTLLFYERIVKLKNLLNRILGFINKLDKNETGVSFRGVAVESRTIQ